MCINSIIVQNGYDIILSSEITLNNKKILFTKKRTLIKELGKPDKIKNLVSDFTDEKFQRLYYGKDYFEISSKGIVVSFSLNTDKFGVTSNQFKVGTQEINLKKIFPNSTEKVIENQGIRLIRVQVYNEEDTFLLFRVKDKRIMSIEIWYNE